MLVDEENVLFVKLTFHWINNYLTEFRFTVITIT